MDRTPAENPHAFANAVESGKDHIGLPLPKDMQGLPSFEKGNPDLLRAYKQNQPGESEKNRGS